MNSLGMRGARRKFRLITVDYPGSIPGPATNF